MLRKFREFTWYHWGRLITAFILAIYGFYVFYVAQQLRQYVVEDLSIHGIIISLIGIGLAVFTLSADQLKDIGDDLTVNDVFEKLNTIESKLDNLSNAECISLK